MKVVTKMMACVAALLMLAGVSGCLTNKVVRSFERDIFRGGVDFICVEQTSLSTDGRKVTDGYIREGWDILQAYRIENRKVTSCRWTDSFNDYATKEKYKAFYSSLEEHLCSLSNQPNRLEKDAVHSSKPPDASVITVTSMRRGGELPPPYPFKVGIATWDYEGARVWANLSEKEKANFKPFCTWNIWRVRQWGGTPDDAPAEVAAARQAMTQMLSASNRKLRCRSYLRAIPLFTEAELEAAKDVPLIDLSQSPKYVRYAAWVPYLLFPAHGWGRPFPTVRKYKPGDVFKAKVESNYFLIETFKGS
ncbi:MAG: hypothetical protein FWG50_05140 [Kiritimatiellaeota bacterium]|nr:hypothetical protein [Kiritimatiellota bacterium]